VVKKCDVTLAGLVYPERAALLSEIQSAVLRIVVLRSAALRNAALRNVAPRSVVLRSVVLQNVALRSAVIHAVAPIVVPTLALNAVPVVAVIQASIPARDALGADFHAAVPSPVRAY